MGDPQADLTEEGIWRTFTVHAATRNLVQLDWTDAGSFIGHSGGPFQAMINEREGLRFSARRLRRSTAYSGR